MNAVETSPRSIRAVLATPRRAVMNDPRFDWARRRAPRRRLVTVLAIVIVLIGAVVAAAGQIGTTAMVSALCALLTASMITVGHLNAAIRGLTELKAGDLDEWQVTRRNAVYSGCWWPSLTLLSAAGFASAFVPMPIEFKAALMLVAYLATLSLPVAVLAWTLPEEPGDEP